jgi:multicomponent Na+:H+ antiporter subunit D
VAYFRPPPEDQAEVREAPLSMLLPTWILIGATLFFGIATRWSAGLARLAAENLLGGGL